MDFTGKMLIRMEEHKDWASVSAVHASAFGRAAEALIVAALREHTHPTVSLVAEENEIIVGHIMFSPVVLTGHPHLKIMGLAPMAVLPDYQRRGIGSVLVRTGLDHCREIGFGAVVVLGHPSYYPRFGFSPASSYHIGCAYEVPDEAFMVTELQPKFLADAFGITKYHQVFDQLAGAPEPSTVDD